MCKVLRTLTPDSLPAGVFLGSLTSLHESHHCSRVGPKALVPEREWFTVSKDIDYLIIFIRNLVSLY